MARQAQHASNSSSSLAAGKENDSLFQSRDASAAQQVQALRQRQPIAQGLTRLAALQKARPELPPPPLDKKVLYPSRLESDSAAPTRKFSFNWKSCMRVCQGLKDSTLMLQACK